MKEKIARRQKDISRLLREKKKLYRDLVKIQTRHGQHNYPHP